MRVSLVDEKLLQSTGENRRRSGKTAGFTAGMWVTSIADGYLQITDRIKDVIKSGGEWVSSLDLENLLSQHEAVSGVGCHRSCR